MPDKKILFLDMDGVICDMPEGRSEMWNDPKWWATFPKYEWSDRLVSTCCDLFETHILSSSGGGPASCWGKMQWLGMHYPWLVNGTIFTRCKYLLAAKDRILVDDDPDNVSLFESFGGKALRFPNPEWYPDGNEDGVKEVFRCLKKYS